MVWKFSEIHGSREKAIKNHLTKAGLKLCGKVIIGELPFLPDA